MAYARTRSSKSSYAATGDLHYRGTSDTPVPLFKARKAAGELFSNDFLSSIVSIAGPQNLETGFHVWKVDAQSHKRLVNLGWVKTSTARSLIYSGSAWTYLNPGARLDYIATKCGVPSVLVPSSHDWSVKHTYLSSELNEGIAMILVSLAESGKTIKMINKAVNLLRSPLVNAKNKLRLTRAQLRTSEGRKALLEQAENDWLEGRYGWRPFVYDVMSWQEAAASKYSERRTVKTLVERVTGTPAIEYKNWSSSGVPPMQRKREYTIDMIASCGQTADYEMNLSQFARTWGALDVAGTAWELVKFSFVIDWFFNLGEALKALQAYAFIAERIGWNKIQRVGMSKTTWTYPAVGYYGDREVDLLLTPELSPTLEQVKLTERTAVTSFVPSLGFSFNVDCAKTLDLLALLHQTLKGSR